ncbi:NAD(P) transhydrogenase subunit alpha [Tyzzerella sp. OttesenSCG-928-J15]|nr:NAD(P) transhydrogenase subunit alpha [Tyzzerella sp. OttesenSCG-928-J15]
MVVGIVKEIMGGERRVSATPETVAKMVQDGLTVLVEKNAGEGSFYSDESYKQAGAEIIADASDVFSKADVILKVKEPQFNTEKNTHEVDMMHDGQALITFIHPASPSNHEMVKNMAKKGVTSITLDGIPRISRAQNMDALTSMSTCAGYKGILMAVNDLPKFAPQIFSAVGMIKPINVLVIGAGVAGLQAIATAKRLGAVVHACDIRPDAVEQAKSLGAKIVELNVPAEVSVGEGGYAKSLPAEWLDKERAIIGEAVKTMDIVFLGALIPGKQAPALISEEMVKTMMPGSVIVDISIDQGGNCEITDPGKVSVRHGITINGIKNIPGLLPTSSTWMFAQNTYNLLKYLVKDGKLNLDRNDEIVASSLTTIGGEVVHAGALEAMNA